MRVCCASFSIFFRFTIGIVYVFEAKYFEKFDFAFRFEPALALVGFWVFEGAE